MKKTKIQLAFERAEKRLQEKKREKGAFFKAFKDEYGITYSEASRKYR